jgi:hypothetical protein
MIAAFQYRPRRIAREIWPATTLRKGLEIVNRDARRHPFCVVALLFEQCIEVCGLQTHHIARSRRAAVSETGFCSGARIREALDENVSLACCSQEAHLHCMSPFLLSD